MHRRIDEEETVITAIDEETDLTNNKDQSKGNSGAIKIESLQFDQKSMQDTRLHPRYQVESRLINLQGGEYKSPVLGQIADISEGGIRFHVKKGGLSIGDVLAIELLDRNAENVRANCVGIVKRFTHIEGNLYEVAVQYRSLGVIARKYVKRMMATGTFMRDIRKLPRLGRQHVMEERRQLAGNLLSTNPRIRPPRYE